MEEVVKIFEKIQGTNSKIDKHNIIAANSNNELFKRCLLFLLSGNIVTGISEKKLDKIIAVTDELYISKINTWEDCMDYLILHNTGTDADIREMQIFIHLQKIEYEEFYYQMITKSLRLGCDDKTVNKAIPGLIPTFNLMLGTPIDKCKLKAEEKIFLSRKLNGTRAAYVGDKIMTRQGKEYVGLEHIVKDLVTLGLHNCFVDGELLYKNKEKLSDSEAFQKGTGIAMSKDGDKSDLKLVVFDIFPINEFWNGKSIDTYSKRKETLLEIKEDIELFGIENVEIVSMVYDGINHSKIWEWLDYAEDNDWEGVMINIEAPYECKRTKNLIKVKKFFSCDLRCTNVEEGNGRNKGTLGALVCDYKGYSVNVGSGFSDIDRKHFWTHQEDIVGKIVTVKYKEETKNKNGGISIQFPVFESVRFDKSEPSYN